VEGALMAVCYKKLFHILIDRDMTTLQLVEKAGFSANIITRLKRDEYVSLESIEKICSVLGCKVDDILEFVPDRP
jgi:putative transcriptional regulator